MQDQLFDLRIKIAKYEDIFKNILESHEDIDQVKETVQYVMDFYINVDKKEDDIEEQADIANYDNKLSEEAESVWRDTILHSDYKSEYEEE